MTGSTEPDITRVTYRWDNGDWYVQTFTRDQNGAEQFEDDSQKVWFAVETDQFGRGDTAELEAALLEAFPDAEIEGTHAQ